MKHTQKILSLLCVGATMFGASCPETTDCPIVSCINMRSQSRNRVHQMVQSVGHVHNPDEDHLYSTVSATLAYQKSFRAKDLAQCLFGSALSCQKGCDGGTITIQGSEFRGDDRNEKALLADYFYLPRDYESTISFEPRIRTVLADLDWYVDLSDYKDGMYFRMHAPIVHTRWNLNMHETTSTKGTLLHPEGYFTPSTLSRDDLLDSFAHYACGYAPGNGSITQNQLASSMTTITPPITVTFQPLKFAQMCCGSQKETGLADLRFEIGRRFIDKDDRHLAFNIQFAAPTGKRKASCLLFGPQIGNGKHFELGAGMHGHWDFWKNEDESQVAGFYLDVNITHLFKAHQIRTFDLCNRPLSRYALAMRFTPLVDNDLEIDNQLPSGQFANEFAPIANITTSHVDVSVNVQADLVAMINYQKNDWSFDFGYNFWARGCEEITCRQDCCPDLSSVCEPDQTNRWAVKGDSRVYGYTGGGFDGTPLGIHPLSATQNCATIYQGNNQTELNFDASDINQNIDNPGLTALDNQFESGTTINTSIDPIYINCADLNTIGTRGISHKVFAHVGKTREYETFNVFFGFGASAEFGKTDDCCPNENSCQETNDSCKPCIDCAVSQWSVWGKLGIDFN